MKIIEKYKIIKVSSKRMMYWKRMFFKEILKWIIIMKSRGEIILDIEKHKGGQKKYSFK